ncbi:MAG: hypothetical protein WC789_01490 [Lentisphaeria bacterium]|jgi:hypothetical protein
MKSAFERAMERLGGGTASFTEEQKAKLADVTAFYTAKIAHAKLMAEAEMRKLGPADAAGEATVRGRLAAEIASLEAEREAKKGALRREFGAE